MGILHKKNERRATSILSKDLRWRNFVSNRQSITNRVPSIVTARLVSRRPRESYLIYGQDIHAGSENRLPIGASTAGFGEPEYEGDWIS